MVVWSQHNPIERYGKTLIITITFNEVVLALLAFKPARNIYNVYIDVLCIDIFHIPTYLCIFFFFLIKGRSYLRYSF